MSVVRAILIEDNEGDADLLRAHLEDVDASYEIEHYATLNDGLSAVRATQADIVVLDLGLPDSQGLEGLARLREITRDTPVVVLTGQSDPEQGLEALRRGAQDYLGKQHADGPTLHRTFSYAIERARLQYARAGDAVGQARIQTAKRPFDAAVELANEAPNGVVVVAFTRPGTEYVAAIDNDGLLVIDATGQVLGPNDKVFASTSPAVVERIGLLVERAIRRAGDGCRVVVDALDTITGHVGIEDAVEFARFLQRRIEAHGAEAYLGLASSKDAALFRSRLESAGVLA